MLVICDLEAKPLDLSLLDDPTLDAVVSCGDVYNDTLRELLGRVRCRALGVHGNHDDEIWPVVEGRTIEDLHLQVDLSGHFVIRFPKLAIRRCQADRLAL